MPYSGTVFQLFPAEYLSEFGCESFAKAVDQRCNLIAQRHAAFRSFLRHRSWNEQTAHHSLPGFVQIFLDALIVPSLQTNFPFSQ